MELNDFLLGYARKGPFKALRKSCYRKFCRWNRGLDDRVTTRYGSSMRVVLGDSVDNRIYVYGYFEPGTSELLRNLAPKSNCFVDVGCNIGYFSCLFAALNPAARIYAIDANPKMIERAEENLLLTGARHFETFNYGVSSQRDTLDFYVPHRRHSHGSFVKQSLNPEECEVFKVSLRPLMDIIDPENLEHAVMKIDTEGYEYYILSGLSHLDIHRFDYILFELASKYLRYAGLKGKDLFAIPWLSEFDTFTVMPDGSLESFKYRSDRQYSQVTCLVRKGLNASL